MDQDSAHHGAAPRLAGRLVAALAVIALAASAGEARADGDPASDVVNAQVLYVSYSFPPPNPLVSQLGGLLERAREKGYEVRVVVLTDQYDMGSVDSLWQKPQQYAKFLAQEISMFYKGRLLIVMPNGYGFNYPGHESTREMKLLSTVQIGSGNGVLRSTQTAVRRLAAAAGVHVKPPRLQAVPAASSPSPVTGSRAKKASGFDPAVIALALGGTLVLGTAVVLIVVQRGRRRASSTTLT